MAFCLARELGRVMLSPQPRAWVWGSGTFSVLFRLVVSSVCAAVAFESRKTGPPRSLRQPRELITTTAGAAMLRSSLSPDSCFTSRRSALSANGYMQQKACRVCENRFLPKQTVFQSTVTRLEETSYRPI